MNRPPTLADAMVSVVETRSSDQRAIWMGPRIEVPMSRDVAIYGGRHPYAAETSWCSCCHESAAMGVTVCRPGGEPGTGQGFVFFCIPCVRRMGDAANAAEQMR